MEKNIDKIEAVFTNTTLFEKEVLHVVNEYDRSEIMHILTDRIVSDVLKEHINFLYIRSFSDFTLKPIINILFKEIANEWISYAIDALQYSKEEALVELQPKDRVKFIHALSASYYRQYKSYIFEAIADTFIELMASISHGSNKSIIINAVINSDLIANRIVLGINGFDQLYKRVRAAKNAKSLEVSNTQIKLSEILKEINNPMISQGDREKLLIVLPKYERKVKEITKQKLENFDASLERVKRSIVNSLTNEIFTN